MDINVHDISDLPAKAENYVEVLNLIENEMLMKMESMRKRAEYADNILTVMEVKRKDKIAAKMLKIELEMKEHLEISNRKCQIFYEQNMTMLLKMEAEAQRAIERQTYEYQAQQNEKIKKQMNEKMCIKEMRLQKLNQDLQDLEENEMKGRENLSHSNHVNIVSKENDTKQAVSLDNTATTNCKVATTFLEDARLTVPSVNIQSRALNKNTEHTPSDKNLDTPNLSKDEFSFEENRYYHLTFVNILSPKLSNKGPILNSGITSNEQSVDNQNLLAIQTSQINRYYNTISFKNTWIEKISEINSVNNHLELKYSLQRMVNTPVNAIAATSSEHMKDKLCKLRELLYGTKSNDTSPQLQLSIDYATNLLACKFVKQGEVLLCMKSVLDEGFQGFAYASIVTALWADHPDFGQLYLAYTYDTCPYLIPQIPSDLPANPSKQDYENRGYKYEEDGTVEKQEKFVTRMSGVARLLACVAVSPLPSGEQGKEHPFGLGNIWRWLCSTLNLPPVNDVTATLLHDVLEITASRLIEQYNKHFLEIIRLLNDVYLDKIKAATIEGSGGPIVRLEQFLKKIINNPSTIKAPSASRLKSGLNYL